MEIVCHCKYKCQYHIHGFYQQARLNEQYRDVGIQVNMGDTIQPRLHVGMATLGQQHGRPSPIAQHVVDADQVEG